MNVRHKIGLNTSKTPFNGLALLCIDGMCCSCKYSLRLLHQFCIINTDATTAAAAADTDTAVQCTCFRCLFRAPLFDVHKKTRDTTDRTIQSLHRLLRLLIILPFWPQPKMDRQLRDLSNFWHRLKMDFY